MRRTLPGLPLALGTTLTYLTLVVLVPISTLVLVSSTMTWGRFVEVVTSERTLAAYRLSFGAAFIAAGVNLVFGVLLAWILERYRFPFRRLVDGIVDLPFALPTAVAGISLASIYAKDGWIGSLLAPFGIDVAFTRLGVVVALVFVGLPFVVRTVQPVLHDLDPEIEEAAATLGASRASVLLRIVLPGLAMPALTGFVLALARGLGEYGSVIFISGNMPMTSEITPLLVMIQLEQYDYPAAAAIALVFLVASFMLLLFMNRLTAYAAPPTRGA